MKLRKYEILRKQKSVIFFERIERVFESFSNKGFNDDDAIQLTIAFFKRIGVISSHEYPFLIRERRDERWNLLKST